MPSSSSTSSDGKSSTRKTTSPASLRNASGRAWKASLASTTKSSSDGALPIVSGSLIGHDDVGRLGRADLEEADVQRLLRLHRPHGGPRNGPQGLGVQGLLRAPRLAGLG